MNEPPQPPKDFRDFRVLHGPRCRGTLEAQLVDVTPEPAPAADALPPLVSLMDLCAGEPDPRKTVLGRRFLCLGGTMLFVGPSGIGKSSASVQQDVLWGLGREAFGIQPARPLKVLTIQAENDAEDLAEMRDGVCAGLNLSAEDRETVRAHVFYESECGRTRGDFLAFVNQRLGGDQFDLLRIDPLLAYLGADPTDTKETAGFLRDGLNPLLAKHQVAAIVNHHTPKVTNRDTSNWRGSDWMYAGAGSADITNWARAILVIDPTHARHVFKFIAAKREARIGWLNEAGEPERLRHFCHASDGLYWRPATDEDLNAADNAATEAKRKGQEKGLSASRAQNMILKLVPPVGTICKGALVALAQAEGIGINTANRTIKILIHQGDLHSVQKARTGTRPEEHVSRHEPGS